jgi:hypothetical protein
MTVAVKDLIGIENISAKSRETGLSECGPMPFSEKLCFRFDRDSLSKAIYFAQNGKRCG